LGVGSVVSGKYGIPRTQALSAKATTAARKRIAQQIRPWEKAPRFVEARERAEAEQKKVEEVEAKPAKGGGTRALIALSTFLSTAASQRPRRGGRRGGHGCSRKEAHPVAKLVKVFNPVVEGSPYGFFWPGETLPEGLINATIV
jgi:hypothetical protein